MNRRDFLKGFGLAPVALLPSAGREELKPENYKITTVSVQSFVEVTNQDGFVSYIYGGKNGQKPLTDMDIEIKNKHTGNNLQAVVKYVHDTRNPDTMIELAEWSSHTLKSRDDIGSSYKRVLLKAKNIGLWDVEGKRWLT
jgi:hypothetical protein